jgi:hypothetical protein
MTEPALPRLLIRRSNACAERLTRAGLGDLLSGSRDRNVSQNARRLDTVGVSLKAGSDARLDSAVQEATGIALARRGGLPDFQGSSRW